MIWLEELQNRKKISRIFLRYEKTFPPEERRDKEAFLALAEHPLVYVFSIHEDEVAIGYALFWELEAFGFLEHFEIYEEYRNHGYGSAALSVLQEKFPRIVLETEPETHSALSKRRIGFYEKNGFCVLHKNYLQPSYGPGKPALQLWLMGNAELSAETATSEIHQKVYGI